jgi:hypothetical protein
MLEQASGDVVGGHLSGDPNGDPFRRSSDVDALRQGEVGMTDVLSIWTVYCSPRDHPDRYVARRFEVSGPEPTPTSDVVVALSLDTIRGYMEMHGLHRMPREEGDQPHIIESWI